MERSLLRANEARLPDIDGQLQGQNVILFHKASGVHKAAVGFEAAHVGLYDSEEGQTWQPGQTGELVSRHVSPWQSGFTNVGARPKSNLCPPHRRCQLREEAAVEYQIKRVAQRGRPVTGCIRAASDEGSCYALFNAAPDQVAVSQARGYLDHIHNEFVIESNPVTEGPMCFQFYFSVTSIIGGM